MKQTFITTTLILLLGLALWPVWKNNTFSASPKPHAHQELTAADVQTSSVPTLTHQWKTAPSDSPSRSLILEKAKQDRAAFITLMKNQPTEALKQAPSIASYAALPAELKPYYAAPLSGLGQIDLLWETSLVGCDHEQNCEHKACHHRNTLEINGTKLQAYTETGHPLPVLHNAPVSGIRLANHAVVSTLRTKTLTGDDIAAAETLFPAGLNPQSPDHPHAALIGGRLHHFAHPADVLDIEKTLVQAQRDAETNRTSLLQHPYQWLSADSGGDQGSSPVDATPFQEEQIDVLFIRVDFSDFQGAPISKTDLETTLATVDGHLDTYSYNKAGITYTVSDSVYRMPNTGASYAVSGDDDTLHNHASALAAANYTLSNYDVVAVYFPSLAGVTGSQIKYGGLASVGGGNHWVNGVNSVGVILHEFGHNYGMQHANYHHPEMSLGSNYQVPGSLEYGDIFDEMGSGSSPEAHFSHLAKNYMQWMPDSKVVEATSNATFTIYRFDDNNALSNSTLAVKVPMAGDITYWIGYRQLYTSTSYNLHSAAYVVGENMAQGRETSLIDMTPESDSNETLDRRDAGLPVGGTHYDTDSGVRFNALEKGGTAPNQWIKVQVLFDPRVSLEASSIYVDEQQGTATVTVKRQYNAIGAVTVNYATSNGTATDGNDYYATSGTLRWADGETQDQTIIIPLCPDITAEGIEDFTITLSNITGGVIDNKRASATVHILDSGQRIPTFTPPFFNVTVNAIAQLADGRVLIGGNIYDVNGHNNISHIARLNTDGSVDTSFVTGSGFNGVVHSIVVQPDGKYLVGGEFTSYNGTSYNRLVRLNSNGSVDTSFTNPTGLSGSDKVRCIVIESSGNLLVGGAFDNFSGVNVSGLVRLAANGGNATALNTPLPSTAEIYDLQVDPDGKIVVVGGFYIGWNGSGFQSGILKLNSNGTQDSSFTLDAGAHVDGSSNSIRNIYSIARQTDGKYIIAGQFTAYNGNAATYCARLDSDCSFDSSFTPPAFNSNAWDVLLQANGNTLVGGRFTSPANRIERLNPNGSADSTFMQGTGFSGTVYKFANGLNGTVWVGGNFYSYNGASCRPIIQISAGDSPYALWAQTRFTATQHASGAADPDSDPDGDGIVNLAEMAMSTSPTVANTTPVLGVPSNNGITLHEDGGQKYLQISIDKTTAAAGVWFLAQFSDNLSIWSPASPTPSSNSTYEVIENSATRYTVRDKSPTSVNNPRFGRIMLKQPH